MTLPEKAHDYEHRIETIGRYNYIRNRAKEHLAYYPTDTLVDFCAITHLSRRQVQRALSFNNTSWRQLKKDASG